MKIRTLFTSLIMASVLSAPAYAEYSKSEIENIIHDYIVNNPDVLIEATANVQRRQQELQKQKQDKLIAEIENSKLFPQSGPAKAKHVIVEFFDYNCGYCKRAKPLFIDLLKESKDTKYIYMEFPILSEISNTAARVGVVIYNLNKEKYVKYNNELMTRTSRLSNEVELQSLVESLDLNWKEVKNMSESKDVDEVINSIREVAAELEVNGTPAFIIDGEILRGAPRSKNDITRLLKK